MVAVPAERPERMPVTEPTVATNELLLVHVPEPGISDSDALAPEQIWDGPATAPGCRLTVATVLILQPVDNV